MTDVAERLGLDGQFDDADLIAYIRDRRWFGSRSKDIAAVTMVDAVPLPGDLPTWLALLELRFETGKHQTYQVVLGVAAAGTVDEEITGLDDGVLYEASQLPRLGRLIVDAPPSHWLKRLWPSTVTLAPASTVRRPVPEMVLWRT